MKSSENESAALWQVKPYLEQTPVFRLALVADEDEEGRALVHVDASDLVGRTWQGYSHGCRFKVVRK